MTLFHAERLLVHVCAKLRWRMWRLPVSVWVHIFGCFVASRTKGTIHDQKCLYKKNRDGILGTPVAACLG